MSRKNGKRQTEQFLLQFICVAVLWATFSFASVGSEEEGPSVGPVIIPAIVSAQTENTVASETARFFENTAFIGNSCIGDIYTYGMASGADFFFRVGLSVKTVLTQSMTTGKAPIIDELNNRKYEKVFVMLGENELGWVYPDYFVSDYGKVIEEIRRRQPDAAIYILSILPVSESTSAINRNCINNNRVQEYNALLANLASQTGAVYIDVGASIKDEKGYLPEDASSDGVHPNKKYCEKWVNSLKEQIIIIKEI